MLHYIRMPTREWWEHPRNYKSRISDIEELVSERFRQEYEANETRKILEEHNDIRAIS